ncbi:MAG: hypothetical protein H7839_06310 [Magnetococcus sp. YQC-5]
MTDEWFEQADLYKAGVLVRRGRPANAEKNILSSVAFDAEKAAALPA